MRFHPIGGGPKTTKMDKKHGSRQETHPLLDRLETAWPCRTRISCRHLVWAAHLHSVKVLREDGFHKQQTQHA